MLLVTRLIASRVLSFADDLQKFSLEIKTTQLLTLNKKECKIHKDCNNIASIHLEDGWILVSLAEQSKLGVASH